VVVVVVVFECAGEAHVHALTLVGVTWPLVARLSFRHL
jgi:hypothetical protein